MSNPTRYTLVNGTLVPVENGRFVEYEEYRAMKEELGEQLRVLQRRLDVRENPGITHSEECYKWHHECAVQRVERAEHELGRDNDGLRAERNHWIKKYDEDLKILRKFLADRDYEPEDGVHGMVAPQVAEWLHDVEKQRDELAEEVENWQEWFEHYRLLEAERDKLLDALDDWYRNSNCACVHDWEDCPRCRACVVLNEVQGETI